MHCWKLRECPVAVFWWHLFYTSYTVQSNIHLNVIFTGSQTFTYPRWSLKRNLICNWKYILLRQRGKRKRENLKNQVLNVLTPPPPAFLIPNWSWIFHCIGEKKSASLRCYKTKWNANEYIMMIAAENYVLKMESYFPLGILTDEQQGKMSRLTKSRAKTEHRMVNDLWQHY